MTCFLSLPLLMDRWNLAFNLKANKLVEGLGCRCFLIVWDNSTIGSPGSMIQLAWGLKAASNLETLDLHVYTAVEILQDFVSESMDPML